MKFFQKPKKNAKIDYRIKLFYIISKKIKACKMFLTQKTIKKLKLTQKSKDEDFLKNLKNLTTNDLKSIALYILKEKNIDISKETATFERLLPGFSEKIQNFSKEMLEIIEKIKKIRRFNEIEEDIIRLLGNVRKKIEKTKVSRKILKEKHKRKREKTQEKIEEPPRYITKNHDNAEKLEKFDKHENYEKLKKLKKNAKTKEFSKEPESFRENTGFYAKTRVFNKNIEKIDKYPERLENLIKVNKNEDVSKITNDYEKIHPSWQASIERRNKEKFVVFQGIHKKL